MDERLPFWKRRDQLTVEGDCVLWGIRVVVPAKLRARVLDELHQGHPGIVRMKSLARSHVWWPDLDARLEERAKACLSCQEIKSVPQKALLHPWVWPQRLWQRVHIDFASPVRDEMLLVIVDVHSKWPEVYVMKSTTATQTIECLRDCFARFGIPEQLISDYGPQFTAEEFGHFLSRNGVKHTRRSPYHPSTNGAEERLVQTVKRVLKAGQRQGVSLKQSLASFLLQYCSTSHNTTGVSPCSLFLK